MLSFVADTAPDKRAKLIDELLAKPEWVDKWTMYFGDLYQNTDNKPSTALRRFPTGPQRVLSVDQGFAQPTASRTTRWRPS